MASAVHRIAVSAGEPAGVGPDICIRLADRSLPCEPVILADRRVIEARAEETGRSVEVCDYRPGTSPAPSPAGRLVVLDTPCPIPVRPGHPDPANAHAVLAALARSVDGCLGGEFDALVTGPVHKGVINDAGRPFPGHTEFLAERSGTPRPVMMLTTGSLRVALATTHLPLAEVPGAITRASLTEIIRVLDAGLRERYRIQRPRILVCGLNPHAGESGHLGDEEQEIIHPVVDALRHEGIDLKGPVAADTAFTPGRLGSVDVVLVMYHDQGLPVLKHAGFGHAVNITLGLPFIRTSVDHGTAFDVAGTGEADPGSLFAALDEALALCGDVGP